ncbi:MAG: hypothetical protein U9Q15_03070 [Patescibacteria group bacterium]|nr:hypothetical protein [Patescibacteria group bacterium]
MFISIMVVIFGSFLFAPQISMDMNFEFIISSLSITYAIIAGFAIQRLNDKFNTIMDLVSEEDGLIKSFWQKIKLLQESAIRKEIKEILQSHYSIIDSDFQHDTMTGMLNKTKKTFYKIEQVLEKLVKILPESKIYIYEQILDIKTELNKNRMYQINRSLVSLSKTDWLLLYMLSLQLVGVLFLYRTGNVVFDFVLAFVSVSIMLIQYIVSELEELKTGNIIIGEKSAEEIKEILSWDDSK